MKRKFMLVTSMVLLAIGILAGSASAALPGTGWWTAYIVVNLSNTTGATVSGDAQELQGGTNTTYSGSDSVAPQANKTYHPAFCGGGAALLSCFSPSLPSGFTGSVVLSSDQPVAALVQVGNNPQGSVGVDGGTASAQYNGKSSQSKVLGFPTVKHNFGAKSTTFYVQAAGADASVTAVYKMNDGQQHSDGPHTISANKSYLFDPVTAGVPGTSCNEANANESPCLGAVTFTSTSGNIVGAVVEHQHSANPATTAQSTSLLADTDGSATVYCPTYKNEFPASNPRTTGLLVQNVGSAATNVTVTAVVADNALHTDPAGTSYSHTVENLQPGVSFTFFPLFNQQNIGNFPAGHFGAVTIQAADANAKLVASVSESNFNDSTKKDTTYSCFSASNASSTVTLPSHKENFGGTGSTNRTGIVVQNVSTTDSTDVTGTFTCNDGNSYTHTAVNLAAGTGHAYFLPSSNASNWTGTAMPEGLLCAVTLQASGGVPIVATGQESATPGTSTNLDTKNYEGINTQ